MYYISDSLSSRRGWFISIKNGGSVGPSVSSTSEREAPLFDATSPIVCVCVCVCVFARARARSTPLAVWRRHHLASLARAFSMRFSSARLSPPSPSRRNCVACAASAYFECPVREYQKLLIRSMPRCACVCCVYARARTRRWSLCVLARASDSRPRAFLELVRFLLQKSSSWNSRDLLRLRYADNFWMRRKYSLDWIILDYRG